LHEEEAFFGGAHYGRTAAGEAGCTHGRIDPEGWDQRTDVLPWKKQYVGMEMDQVRQMKQLQEENSRLKK
jgi:hypothetical protein